MIASPRRICIKRTVSYINFFQLDPACHRMYQPSISPAGGIRRSIRRRTAVSHYQMGNRIVSGAGGDPEPFPSKKTSCFSCIGYINPRIFCYLDILHIQRYSVPAAVLRRILHIYLSNHTAGKAAAGSNLRGNFQPVYLYNRNFRAIGSIFRNRSSDILLSVKVVRILDNLKAPPDPASGYAQRHSSPGPVICKHASVQITGIRPVIGASCQRNPHIHVIHRDIAGCISCQSCRRILCIFDISFYRKILKLRTFSCAGEQGKEGLVGNAIPQVDHCHPFAGQFAAKAFSRLISSVITVQSIYAGIPQSIISLF